MTNHTSAWTSSKMTVKMVGEFKANLLVREFPKNKTTEGQQTSILSQRKERIKDELSCKHCSLSVKFKSFTRRQCLAKMLKHPLKTTVCI